MAQHRVRAVYMRGGTSRCLAFHERDLPPAGPERDRILLSALGSPDPYGRQLDGLGGGISSLSKAFIIGAPTHPDAQVDYTFAQVEVSRTVVDYTGNCGNCSSAVGPFAIDERLVPSADGETAVRIHNTNTKKIIVARVPVVGRRGRGAGRLRAARRGRPRRPHRARLPGPRRLPHRPAAALRARARDRRGRRGLDGGRDQPDGLRPRQGPRADRHRDAAGDGRRPSARGAARGHPRAAPRRPWAFPGSAATPKIAVVAPPTGFVALDGAAYDAEQTDVVARCISMGNAHRAFALTAAMCLAVAAQIDGTVVSECAGGRVGDLRLGHPSGVLPIAATVGRKDGAAWAERVTVYRTARRLMEGYVRVP